MTRSNRPPLVDPYLHQPQAVSLRQYADWFRATYPKEAKEEDEADRAAEKEAGRKTRDGIRARWEKYKKKHLSMQVSRVPLSLPLSYVTGKLILSQAPNPF